MFSKTVEIVNYWDVWLNSRVSKIFIRRHIGIIVENINLSNLISTIHKNLYDFHVNISKLRQLYNTREMPPSSFQLPTLERISS